MHEAAEALIAVVIVALAWSYGVSAIASVATSTIAQRAEEETWRGSLTLHTLLIYFADNSSKLAYLNPDKVASLSEVYRDSGGPYEGNYTRLLNDKDKLGLSDVNFHLQMRPSLQVDAEETGEGIVVSVFKGNETKPVQAQVKLYLVDEGGVSAYSGETGIEGKFIFNIQASGKCALIFAKVGASVGYSAVGNIQVRTDRGYVQNGVLKGSSRPASFKIFSFEDYSDSSGQVSVGGFSLPVLLVWEEEGSWNAIPYPHLPEGYGPTPSAQVFKLATSVFIGNGVFQVDLEVWRRE